MGRATPLLIVACLCASGCYLAHERDVDAGADRDAAPAGPLVWVLVHPSDAPLGPGLFLFDETRHEILRQLPLPAGVTSPHALTWGGHSLWLGGIDDDPGLRELDPADGHVVSRIPSVFTEGIAIDGDTLWWTGIADARTPLFHAARDATFLRTSTLDEVSVQDLANVEGTLYYLVNDDLDRIMRFDPETESATEIARHVHVAPYSLGFDGTSLAVAVDGRIRRYDPVTGALVRDSAFEVPGWITAIAFVR